MGQIFDIAKPSPRKAVAKTQTQNNQNVSNAWLYFGLIIIIFLIVADFGSKSPNTQIAQNDQPTNEENPKVLGDDSINTNDQQNQVIPDANEKTEESIVATNNIDDPANDNNSTQNSINKSEIKIRILNGSKIPGAALKAKEKLTTNGYVIDNIGTAKNNYNVTTIYYNKGKKDIAVKVKLDLENQNALLEENTTLTANYDLLIVIGTKWL